MTVRGRDTCAFPARPRTLTQGFQVVAFESAVVEAEALQAREVSQVEGETVQASSKTLVRRQVQLSQSREGAKSAPCSTTKGEDPPI